MYKLVAALLLLSSPVFAQTKGDTVYGMDCKGLKPEKRAENQPNMPPTKYEGYGHSEVGRDTESRDHSHNRGE
jgi:hypothetical protein